MKVLGGLNLRETRIDNARTSIQDVQGPDDIVNKQYVDAIRDLLRSELERLEGELAEKAARLDLDAVVSALVAKADLGMDRKLRDDQVPSLAVTDVYVVPDVPSLGTLTDARKGDIGMVSAGPQSGEAYMLVTDKNSSSLDWTRLVTREGLVLSVASKVGHVSLEVDDVDGLRDELAARSPLSHSHHFSQLSGVPDYFDPSPHAHAMDEVRGLGDSLRYFEEEILRRPALEGDGRLPKAVLRGASVVSGRLPGDAEGTEGDMAIFSGLLYVHDGTRWVRAQQDNPLDMDAVHRNLDVSRVSYDGYFLSELLDEHARGLDYARTALDWKADLVDGKVPAYQLPPMQVSKVFVVASRDELTSLYEARTGDIAVVEDIYGVGAETGSFILMDDSYWSADSWKPFSSSGVRTVAGRSGDVLLSTGDVSGLSQALDAKQDRLPAASSVGQVLTSLAGGALGFRSSGVDTPIITVSDFSQLLAAGESLRGRYGRIVLTAHITVDRAAVMNLQNIILEGNGWYINANQGIPLVTDSTKVYMTNVGLRGYSDGSKYTSSTLMRFTAATPVNVVYDKVIFRDYGYSPYYYTNYYRGGQQGANIVMDVPGYSLSMFSCTNIAFTPYDSSVLVIWQKGSPYTYHSATVFANDFMQRHPAEVVVTGSMCGGGGYPGLNKTVFDSSLRCRTDMAYALPMEMVSMQMHADAYFPGVMSPEDKAKLDTLSPHGEGDGHLHLPPAGYGSPGRVLMTGDDPYSSAWKALTPSDVGAAPSAHAHAEATASSAGFMPSADKSKVDRLLLPSGTSQFSLAHMVSGSGTHRTMGLAADADILTQTASGFYRRPSGVGMLAVSSADVNVRSWLELSFSDGMLYHSWRRSDGTWTEPVKVWTSGNLDPGASGGGGSHEGLYLPIAGGSLRGPLDMGGNPITTGGYGMLSESGAMLMLHNIVSGGALTLPSSGGAYFNTSLSAADVSESGGRRLSSSASLTELSSAIAAQRYVVQARACLVGTASPSGLLVDGLTLSAGDTVLHLRPDGVYGRGDGTLMTAAAGAWQTHPLMSDDAKAARGLTVAVTSGNAYAGSSWLLYGGSAGLRKALRIDRQRPLEAAPGTPLLVGLGQGGAYEVAHAKAAGPMGYFAEGTVPDIVTDAFGHIASVTYRPIDFGAHNHDGRYLRKGGDADSGAYAFGSASVSGRMSNGAGHDNLASYAGGPVVRLTTAIQANSSFSGSVTLQWGDGGSGVLQTLPLTLTAGTLSAGPSVAYAGPGVAASVMLLGGVVVMQLTLPTAAGTLSVGAFSSTLTQAQASGWTLAPDAAATPSGATQVRTYTVTPPGGGSVQADFAQTDSARPDFIRNKPTIPTVGTLDTTSTSAQSTSASESLSGTVKLHKVSKTGSYADLAGRPAIPTVGTLDTTSTSAQSTSASESLSGAVRLHKVSKTGSYADLISKPILDTTSYTPLDTYFTEELSGLVLLHRVSKTGYYDDLVGRPGTATSQTDGMLSASLYDKLTGVSPMANRVEASATNGNVKVDGAETAVYRHPSGDGSRHLPQVGGGDVSKVLWSGGAVGGAPSWKRLSASDVDGLDSLTGDYLPLSGGALAGALSMGGNAVRFGGTMSIWSPSQDILNVASSTFPDAMLQFNGQELLLEGCTLQAESVTSMRGLSLGGGAVRMEYDDAQGVLRFDFL